MVQRRSRPLLRTYDPWLRAQCAHRVPRDGLLPQAPATLHELPGAQRSAPLPSHAAGPAAELQLGLEQVTGAGSPGVEGQGTGLASAPPESPAFQKVGIMYTGTFSCGDHTRWPSLFGWRRGGPLGASGLPESVSQPGTVGLEFTVTVHAP